MTCVWQYIVPSLIAVFIGFVKWLRSLTKKTDKARALQMPLPSRKPNNVMIMVGDSANLKALAHKLVLPSNMSQNRQCHLVLIFPGNPGVPGFYEPFMRYLHAVSDESVEVCCICHTGHSSRRLNEDKIFNLQDQIQHKLSYVQSRLKENPHLKVSIVGHSIGAYIGLQMLRHFSTNIHRIVLLTPTVMHMGKTPNGQRMFPIFRWYRFAAYICWLPSLLPTTIKYCIASLVIGRDSDESLKDAAVSLADYYIGANCLYMALHEMNEVGDLDVPMLEGHQRKLLFIYAENDAWCPASYANQLQGMLREAKHIQATAPHAFMLDPDGSRVMAEHTWEWIKMKK